LLSYRELKLLPWALGYVMARGEVGWIERWGEVKWRAREAIATVVHRSFRGQLAPSFLSPSPARHRHRHRHCHRHRSSYEPAVRKYEATLRRPVLSHLHLISSHIFWKWK